LGVDLGTVYFKIKRKKGQRKNIFDQYFTEQYRIILELLYADYKLKNICSDHVRYKLCLTAHYPALQYFKINFVKTKKNMLNIIIDPLQNMVQ